MFWTERNVTDFRAKQSIESVSSCLSEKIFSDQQVRDNSSDQNVVHLLILSSM